MKPSPRSERLYLTDIVDAIDRVLEYTAQGRSAFLADRKTQDAVSKNVAVMGEAVRSVSQTTRDAHPEIPWSDIAGMRDRLVHGYFRVDLNIVWDVVENDLPGFRAAIERLLRDV